MKNKTKVRIFIIITIALAFTGFIYYYQTNISIWGFNISKNELKNVLIQTKDNNYLITNPKLVLELAQEVAKTKKLYKLEPSNFPPKEAPTKYLSLVIGSNSNMGGSFWDDSNSGLMLDSNGYYWSVSSGLIELMDKSLKEAQKLL